MELRFYGLSAPPFGMAPDRRFFFASEQHRRSLAYLKYGLQQGEGFIVITGAVGTGKSILAARLMDEIEPAEISLVRLATPQLEPEAALRFILSSFGLEAQGDKAVLLRAAERFLRQEAQAGRKALLLVDEAQALKPETLDELRMLSNLGADGAAPLLCFLFGQPLLATLLARPELEQVRQRIVASNRLAGLSEAETRAYVEHRLTLVGWRGDPEFAPDLWPRLHEETGGIPRRINIICGRLLLYGAVEELHRLDASHLDEALRDLREEALDPAAPPTVAPAPFETTFEITEVAEALRPLVALLTKHDAALCRILALLERRESRGEPTPPASAPNAFPEELPADSARRGRALWRATSGRS